MSARKPVSKGEMFEFCRAHLDFFVEIYEMDISKSINTLSEEEEKKWIKDVYPGWRRMYMAKRREIVRLVGNKFGHKEPFQAADRIIRFYFDNNEEIRDPKYNICPCCGQKILMPK